MLFKLPQSLVLLNKSTILTLNLDFHARKLEHKRIKDNPRTNNVSIIL